MRDFFDAPELAPDTACLGSIVPIPFVTGVVYSDWVGAAVARIWQRPWLAGLPGLAVLLLLVSAVGIPVRHFRGRNRCRPDSSRFASLVLFLVTLVGLTFIGTLAAAVMAGARRHLFVPAIGLPEAWPGCSLCPGCCLRSPWSPCSSLSAREQPAMPSAFRAGAP